MRKNSVVDKIFENRTREREREKERKREKEEERMSCAFFTVKLNR